MYAFYDMHRVYKVPYSFHFSPGLITDKAPTGTVALKLVQRYVWNMAPSKACKSMKSSLENNMN